MKLAAAIMIIAFGMCAGVSLGGENASQEGNESLAMNEGVVVSNKTILYDSAYDEQVTKEISAKTAEGPSEKSPKYSAVEINTEVSD